MLSVDASAKWVIRVPAIQRTGYYMLPLDADLGLISALGQTSTSSGSSLNPILALKFQIMFNASKKVMSDRHFLIAENE